MYSIIAEITTVAAITSQLLTASPVGNVDEETLMRHLEVPNEYAPFINEEVGEKSQEIRELLEVIDERETEIDGIQLELSEEVERRKAVESNVRGKRSGVINRKNSRNNDNDGGVSSRDSVTNGVSPSPGGRTKTLNVEATAYTAYCDTGCTGTTADGTDIRNTIHMDGKRIVAVDPSVIPLRSVVQVNHDGASFEAVAADTGGDIRGNRIDILVGSKDEALAFGRQDVRVEILR